MQTATLWDGEAATRQAHNLKIAGSIPAPTTLLALCLGKQLEVVMGKPNFFLNPITTSKDYYVSADTETQ